MGKKKDIGRRREERRTWGTWRGKERRRRREDEGEQEKGKEEKEKRKKRKKKEKEKNIFIRTRMIKNQPC